MTAHLVIKKEVTHTTRNCVVVHENTKHICALLLFGCRLYHGGGRMTVSVISDTINSTDYY